MQLACMTSATDSSWPTSQPSGTLHIEAKCDLPQLLVETPHPRRQMIQMGTNDAAICNPFEVMYTSVGYL